MKISLVPRVHPKNNLFLLTALFFALSLFSPVEAQKTKNNNLSITVRDESLETVFAQLTKQINYKFIYDQQVVANAPRITLNMQHVQLFEVLAEITKQTKLYFYQVDKTISVTINKVTNETSPKSGKKNVKVVAGVVVDAKDEPVIGANIKLGDTGKGTITDFNGKFSIEVADENELEVSYIGYENQRVVVDPEVNDIKVILYEDLKKLDEVVVVGYGTQKKVNLTGAISSISKGEINDRPVSNLTNALKGLDPSLGIRMSSGVQDAGYSIDIRGSISVNGGSPLVLIDGVETSLNMVNPNDVESVSVLKDASASAIYGAKASAGVVLITTKSGSQGKNKNTVVSYNSRMAVKESTTSTDFNTSGYWSVYVADLFYNSRYGMNYTNYSDDEYQMLWDRRNDKVESPDRPWIITNEDGTYRYFANTDWYGYLWRREMPQQEHNISISGGNDKVDYYVSGRYFHDEGMFKIVEDVYDTYSFRSKLNVKLTPKIKYQSNINFFSSENLFNGYSDRNKTYYFTRVHGLASFPATNPDGTAVYLSNHSNTSSTLGDGVMAALIYGKHRNVNNDNYIIIGNQVDADITKDLRLTASHSFLFRNRKYANRCVNVPYSMQEGVVSWLTTGQFTNNYNEQHYYVKNNNFNMYGTYQYKSKNEHNLSAVAGLQYEQYGSNSLKIKRQDLLSDELDSFSLSTGELETFTQSISEYRTLGFFGRTNYDYKGKYLLEVSARYDGSSRFDSKNRWGFFPSASVGWRISEEDFWSVLNNTWDNAKIRFSVGSLGNQQVDYYAYVDKIDTDGVLDYSLDGNTKTQYAYESKPISSDLTWETVTTYDLGVDWAFFKSRLNITADIFRRETKDMLTTSLTLPAVYGAKSPQENCANLQTEGWEIRLTWNDRFQLNKKEFKYSLSGSLGDYQTTITKYDNSNKLLSDYYEGMKLGEIWGYKIDGLFNDDAEAAAYSSQVNMDAVNVILLSSVDNYYRGGDMKYIDLDGDHVISAGAGTVDNPGDREIIGNAIPRYSYTFGGNASWNNIDFSILFSGVAKQDWYPTTEAETFWFGYSRPYTTYLSKDFLSMTWTDDNPNGYFPRIRGYQTFDGGQLFYTNDRYLQNVAYCRLKNLTLGYTVPVFKKLFQQFRIYVAGENLAYWSPLKRYTKYIDPEQVTSSSEYKQGSAQAYGFTKSFTVGLDITF